MKSLLAFIFIWTCSALPLFGAEISGAARVVDGDTVEISTKKIRLIGIDSPETDQLCLDRNGNRWACGIEAREKLAQKTAGKNWLCRSEEVDRYGRLLGACEVAGEDINRWMVGHGWALAFVRYSRVYVADELEARTANLGIWAGAFIAPWDWRSRSKKTEILGAATVPANAQMILLSAVSAAEAPSPECVIKANMTRSNECIYHMPGGRFYSVLKMDLSKGKRWFCTEREAEAAGCRKSMR